MSFVTCVLITDQVHASPASASPNNQIVVVTVNAEQYYTYDPARLTQLAAALSTRPTGTDGSHYAPDVIIADEVTAQTITEFRQDLNASFGGTATYQVYGDQSFGHGSVGFLVNTQTMTVGRNQTWADPCYAGRLYQWLNVTQVTSGLAISVAGLHFDPQSTEACRQSNVSTLRQQLAAAGTNGSVVGDFNKRPVTTERECDPDERSTPLGWYTDMTSFSGSDNRSYVDTVRSYDRTFGISMANEWTHENANVSTLCNNVDSYKRARIDYVFVSNSTSVIEAHADAPGWANPTVPGQFDSGCSTNPALCHYSDHRFVWARIDLSGLSAPLPPNGAPSPTATPIASPSPTSTPTQAPPSPTPSPTPTPTPTVAALTVTTTTCPTATTKVSYTCTLLATGGKPPYTWSVTSGKLPQGLSLSSSGTISGKAIRAGTYGFTATAKDAASPSHTASQSLSITVK